MSDFVTLYGVERQFFELLRKEYTVPRKRNLKKEQACFKSFIGVKGIDAVSLSNYKMSDLYTSFDRFLDYWNDKESSDTKKQDEALAMQIESKYVPIYYIFFFFYLLSGFYPERKDEVSLKLLFAFEDIKKKKENFFYSDQKIGVVLTALTDALKDADYQYYSYDVLYEHVAKTLFEEYVRKSSDEPELMVINLKDAMRSLGIDKIENVLYVLARGAVDVKIADDNTAQTGSRDRYFLLNEREKIMEYFRIIDGMLGATVDPIGGSPTTINPYTFGIFTYLGRRFRIVPFGPESFEIFLKKRRSLDMKKATVGDFIQLLINTFLIPKEINAPYLNTVAKFLATGIFTGVLYYVFKTDAPKKRKKAPIRRRPKN